MLKEVRVEGEEGTERGSLAFVGRRHSQEVVAEELVSHNEVVEGELDSSFEARSAAVSGGQTQLRQNLLFQKKLLLLLFRQGWLCRFGSSKGA